jgi:hypothetical protein
MDMEAVGSDVVPDDDEPIATCIDCAAETFDLTAIGEAPSAGRDMPT